MTGKKLLKLLKLLRENGVKSFEDSELNIKVEFGERANYAEPIITQDHDPDIEKKISQLQQMSDEELRYYSSKG